MRIQKHSHRLVVEIGAGLAAAMIDAAWTQGVAERVTVFVVPLAAAAIVGGRCRPMRRIRLDGRRS